MPTPKISAILNNCPVHLGVPELIEAFKHFSLLEQGQAGIKQALNRRSYKENYALLKDKFAEFYNQDKAALSWKKLHLLVTEHINNNPTAAQFILGPVLREFMRDERMIEDTLCNLQDDGRFATLDSVQVERKLYTPLGIKIISHEKPQGLASASAEVDIDGYLPPEESKAEDEAFELDAYNEDHEHWERLPHRLIARAENGQTKLLTDCPEISAAFDRIAGGNSIRNTEAGFKLLKAAVTNLLTWQGPAKQFVAQAAFDEPTHRAADSFAETAKQAFTARVRNKVKALSTPQELQAVTQKVKTHYAVLFARDKNNEFNLAEAQKIDLAQIDKAQANAGESDEDFAKRLQEAELRSFKLGK